MSWWSKITTPMINFPHPAIFTLLDFFDCIIGQALAALAARAFSDLDFDSQSFLDSVSCVVDNVPA
jgi:hypothetical protein